MPARKKSTPRQHNRSKDSQPAKQSSNLGQIKEEEEDIDYAANGGWRPTLQRVVDALQLADRKLEAERLTALLDEGFRGPNDDNCRLLEFEAKTHAKIQRQLARLYDADFRRCRHSQRNELRAVLKSARKLSVIRAKSISEELAAVSKAGQYLETSRARHEQDVKSNETTNATSSSTLIYPEFRTRPMTLKEAAKYMGFRGKGPSGKKKMAERLRNAIDAGTVNAEKLNRVSWIFDINRFHKVHHPEIKP